jgi:hypothetical protein
MMNQPHTPPGDNDNLFQTNLILPEPTVFLSPGLPACSVIRPISTEHSGAVAAVMSFRDDNLFMGQSQDFLATIMQLAMKADQATRQLKDD